MHLNLCNRTDHFLWLSATITLGWTSAERLSHIRYLASLKPDSAITVLPDHAS